MLKYFPLACEKVLKDHYKWHPNNPGNLKTWRYADMQLGERQTSIMQLLVNVVKIYNPLAIFK